MDYTVHGILLAGILEWVAIPFSRVSSQPRDQTRVSCIADRDFTVWATRELLKVALAVKNSPASAAGTGHMGSIPGLESSPLQYSCLENPMDRGAWQATVHRVPKIQAQLKRSKQAKEF